DAIAARARDTCAARADLHVAAGSAIGHPVATATAAAIDVRRSVGPRIHSRARRPAVTTSHEKHHHRQTRKRAHVHLSSSASILCLTERDCRRRVAQDALLEPRRWRMVGPMSELRFVQANGLRFAYV